MLRITKSQIQKHREERRELREKLEDLTNPMFLVHADQDKNELKQNA